jgi:hypothetical protein
LDLSGSCNNFARISTQNKCLDIVKTAKTQKAAATYGVGIFKRPETFSMFSSIRKYSPETFHEILLFFVAVWQK